MIGVPMCAHERKTICTSPTTNYPPPAIICLDCGATIITVEEAKRLVALAPAKTAEDRG